MVPGRDVGRSHPVTAERGADDDLAVGRENDPDCHLAADAEVRARDAAAPEAQVRRAVDLEARDDERRRGLALADGDDLPVRLDGDAVGGRVRAEIGLETPSPSKLGSKSPGAASAGEAAPTSAAVQSESNAGETIASDACKWAPTVEEPQGLVLSADVSTTT